MKWRKIGKILWEISSTVVLIFLVGLAIWLHLIEGDEDASYQLRAVLTGSMSEVFPAGSLIVSKSVDPNKLEIGDIITYEINGVNVSHRIEFIEDSTEFITKGDSNSSRDNESVVASQIRGKVVLALPRLGKWFLVLQSSHGRIALLLTIIQILLLEMLIKLLSESECIQV